MFNTHMPGVQPRISSLTLAARQVRHVSSVLSLLWAHTPAPSRMTEIPFPPPPLPFTRQATNFVSRRAAPLASTFLFPSSCAAASQSRKTSGYLLSLRIETYLILWPSTTRPGVPWGGGPVEERRQLAFTMFRSVGDRDKGKLYFTHTVGS